MSFLAQKPLPYGRGSVRSRARKQALLGALVLCCGSAVGQKAVPKAGPQDKAEKAAFTAICGACHDVSIADGLRSKSEWIETIEQMVSLGATGTDEEFDRVMRYLLRNLTKVNVNTATAQEIAPVLDVSDVTAQAIVKRRAA